MKFWPARRSKKRRKACLRKKRAPSPTPRKCSCQPPAARAERVDHEAKRAIAAVHEGDMLTTQMAVLKRFGKRPAVDTIALRRRVAAAVQSQDRYPFEGR